MESRNPNQPAEGMPAPAPAAATENRNTYVEQPHTHAHAQAQAQPVYYQTMMPPQQQQQVLGAAPPRSRSVLYSRPWNIAKIVLRSSDIVCAIIVIALSIFFIFNGYYAIYLAVIFALPAAAGVFLWEVAELITLCARGGKLGIHPGAHVGLHLIFWLYLAVGIGFYAALATYDLDNDSYYYYYHTGSTSYAAITYTLMAFMAIMLAINFALFVRACVETQQVNRTLGQTRTVYVVQNPQHMSMAYPQPAYMMAAPPGQMMQQGPPRESAMFNPQGSMPPQGYHGDIKTQGGEPSAPQMEYYAPQGNTYGPR